jgi:hypothetical protein
MDEYITKELTTTANIKDIVQWKIKDINERERYGRRGEPLATSEYLT